MTTKTHMFEAIDNALVIYDRNSLESVLCDESELAEALTELNPDAPQEVNDAIEQLAFAWENDECVTDLMSYLGIEIRNVDESAFSYEYVGRYNDETYDSVKRRIAALWGFDTKEIINIDWLECRTAFDGDMWVTTPIAADYEIADGSGLKSYSTDFVRNYCTSI